MSKTMIEGTYVYACPIIEEGTAEPYYVPYPNILSPNYIGLTEADVRRICKEVIEELKNGQNELENLYKEKQKIEARIKELEALLK